MKDIFKGNGFLHVSYGNGDVYIGNFKNGIRCGEGKLWTSDNKIRGGNWNLSEGMGQYEAYARPEPELQSRKFGFRCCANEAERQALFKNLTK